MAHKLKVKRKMIKLRDNIGENLCDFGNGDTILDKTTKT